MKRFNTDAVLNSALQSNGAFFAFSKSQFEEQKQEGINYISIGHGMVCPSENIDKLIHEMENISKNRISWELENNTKKEIIWYELANHECQIVGNYSEVVELLTEYGITREEIAAEWGDYFQHCIDNDYF